MAIEKKSNEENSSNSQEGISENEEQTSCNEGVIIKMVRLLLWIAHLLQKWYSNKSKIQELKKREKELLGPTARDGVLRWNISNFSQKRDAAVNESQKCVTSDDFFTPEGHRMCAVAYLNGCGEFVGKCVSLFLIIKKGAADGTLAWPLPYTNITFQIRSQGNGDHWEKNLPVDHRDQRFLQPVTEQNGGVGFEDFIDLAQLMIPENQYIQQNKLCVMITVKGKS